MRSIRNRLKSLRSATVKPAVQAVSQAAVTSNKPLKSIAAGKIKNNTIQYKGMDFPRLSLTNTKSTNASGSCCEVGTQRTITVGSFARDSPPRMKKDWSDLKQHPYFASGCWVIDYGTVNISTIGTPASYITSTVASNLSFNTSEEYTSVLSSLNNYVFNLDIPDAIKVDLNAKLEEFVSNYQQMAYQLNSSHSGFIVTTILKGTGRLNVKTKHSWIHGSFTVTETCCPPQVTDPNALLSGLRAWVDDTASGFKKPRDIGSIRQVELATIREIAIQEMP